MNKILLTISFAAFLGFFSLSAQTSLILGVNGGVGLNQLKGTGDYTGPGMENPRAFGYQGGATVGMKFGGFSILTGLGYKSLNGKSNFKYTTSNPVIIDGTAYVGDYNESIKYAALDVPILLRYEFGGDFKITLAAGPVVNMGISDIVIETTYDLVDYSIQPVEARHSYGKSATDFFKSSWVSFYFSPGVLYKIDDNSFFKFNIEYEAAGNLVNDRYTVRVGNEVYTPSGSIKMNSLRFSIGYEYRIDFQAGTKY